MDYYEKKSILSIATTIVVFGIYYWYVLGTYESGTLTTQEELQFWSKAILMGIPVSIATKILVFIPFGVYNMIYAKETIPCFEDERDKLIELKSSRNSYFVFGAAFGTAMVVMAFGFSPIYMFEAFIVGGIASDVTDNLSRLFYHRRGI